MMNLTPPQVRHSHEEAPPGGLEGYRLSGLQAKTPRPLTPNDSDRCLTGGEGWHQIMGLTPP